MRKFFIASALFCTAAFTGCSAIQSMNFSSDYEGDQVRTPAQVDTQPEVTVDGIIDELNLARTNPRAYASILKQRRQYYKGKVYSAPGQRAIGTTEGLKALDEAIRYLESVSPMQALSYSDGLSKAAMDHVNDIGPKGMMSHVGSNGTRVNKRIERYGQWNDLCGENIMYGSYTARDIIISLIVDDGVADRGHRRAIYTPDYAVVGTAFGYHSEYGIVCVQNFAASFREGVTGNSTATTEKKATAEKKEAAKVRTASRRKGK
ncbi:MAG: CAP domain-containing protein [Bacteroidota bacterium]